MNLSSSHAPRILIIDNYDSFTYNLVHLVHEYGLPITVWRNDQFDLEEVENFDKIILSPGPGIPKEAGLLMQVIEKYGPSKSILGICLGMQAIGEVYGGQLYNLSKPVHGLATPIKLLSKVDLFKTLEDEIVVGRYHSWAMAKDNFPDSLEIIAEDMEGVIMAVRHKEFNVTGVQFHPESIMTEKGLKMISNWIEI